MPRPKATLQSTLQRFHNNYIIDNNGCWIWQQAKDNDGYGIFWNMKKTLAHQFSAEYLGNMIRLPHECVCHLCDIPACVNPNHLFIGSRGTNNKDRHLKNRSAVGSKVGTSKLTEENVKYILDNTISGKRGGNNKLSNSNVKDIAKMFDIEPSVVYNIINRKTWKHVK